MTFVVADRVQENGTIPSTATGIVNLSGPVNGYQSFVSGIGNGNTTYYTIYDATAYTWEVGLGTVISGTPNTLTRTTVYANSAGTAPAKVTFSTTNSLTVFVTYPAEQAIYTGSNASLNTVTATSTAYPAATASSGVYSYGTLNYSDTGILGSYQANTNSYAQVILQNTNNGTQASTDYIVSSNGGTATTNYGDFGINSSFYSAYGSALNSPSTVYLYSQSTDLAIGTNSSNSIHFVINNQVTDALTINSSSSIAFNGQYGYTGQVLTSQGSSNPPIWSNAGGSLVVVEFTATAGQTTFSTMYVVGTTSVFRNGIRLGQADYTATNGTSFTLNTGAAAGDLITLNYFTALNIYSTIVSQDFSGTGSATSFTLSSNPANSASLLVAINGVVQDPANYTISGNTLTFTTAPAAGTNNISTRTLGIPSTTTVSSFSAGTTGFSPQSAASGAVTLGGILAVTNGGTGLTTLTSGYIPYGNGTGAFSSSSNFVFNGSQLGIGTSSPSWPLQVQTSSGDAQIYLTSTGTNNSGQFIANGNGSGSYPAYNLYQSGTNYWSFMMRADTNLYLQRQSGTGNIYVPVGNAIFQTSGAGIQFTNSSALTNSVLNDYETGSYTPTVTNTGGTISYTAAGQYTKVGKLVTVSMSINISSVSANGYAVVSVPFTTYNNGGVAYPLCGRENAATGYSINGYIGANTTTGATFLYANQGTAISGYSLLISITYTAA